MTIEFVETTTDSIEFVELTTQVVVERATLEYVEVTPGVIEVVETTPDTIVVEAPSVEHVEIGIQGPPGGDAVNELFRPSYVSGHPGTLTKGMAVCLVAGLLRRATNFPPFNNVLGLLYEGNLNEGVSGRVQTGGSFTAVVSEWEAATGLVGGLSPQQTYFLTGTGAIQPFAPDTNYITPVGLALTSTTLRIGFNTSVLL